MKKVTLLIICFLVFALAGHASERPLIGLTGLFIQDRVQLHHDYILAIVENGGTPVILPPSLNDEVIENYIDMIDGVVFTGGMDIPPELYGQEPHYTTKTMSPIRSEFEQKFIRACLKSGKPAMGVCLGMQFTNVLCGGSMYQDIPSLIGKKVCHRNGEMYTNYHAVGIARGSLLEKILGTTSVKVNSRHHQAVDRIAPNFSVAARSSDGVIEAIVRNDGPFGIFVQWHPESMKEVNPEHRNRLFSALIKEAAKH